MSNLHLLPGPANGDGSPQSVELVPRPYLEAPRGSAPHEDGESDSLIVYWRLLQRHRGVLLLACALGIIAAVLITLPQTPVYQAIIAIEIQGLNEDFLNMRSLTQTGSANWDPSYDIQTQVREMQSRPLLERVIKKMKAADRAELMSGAGRVTAWRKALHLSDPKPPSLEAAVALASENLKFRPSMTSRIVEITCDSVNPNVSAQFLNTLAEEYIQANMESRWEASQKTGDFLTRQLQDLKIRLEKSEDELQVYSNKSGLMFITGDKEKSNVAEEKLRQLQEEIIRAESDRVAKQSHFDTIKDAPVESIAEVLDDKTLSEYAGKLTDLRREMAGLDVALTAENPKVKKLQAQIDTVEGALRSSRKNILDRLTSDYQSSQNRENLLSAKFDAQKQLVSEQSAKVIHYNILKREVDTNRSIYEAMLQKVKESGIASAIKASGVRVVDPAVPPKIPYKPNLTRSGILGLMGGLVFGVIFVFIRERSDRNLQQPGDSAFYLNLPELGVIPISSADRVTKLRGRRAVTDEAAAAPEIDRVELVTWNRKLSLLAEAFRTTLTSVLFSGPNGAQPRLIVLTSASPAEGKTTVSVNLAIALSEINRRVLLIDADMRRPRLQNVFDLGPGPGLADLLREKTQGEPLAMERAVNATSIPGLFVMRSGGTPGVVSNLLHSSRLPELMQELRAGFDAVVIDTPPALHIADARVIGRLADAVLLVVRAGKTTRDAALMVKQRFGEDGTPVMGTILNGWDCKREAYGYKNRYYNGSTYYTQQLDETEVEK